MKENTQNTFIAKTFAGLEEVLAGELRELGAEEVNSLRRAVMFKGDLRMLYRANIRCRSAISILKSVAGFSFTSKDSFYEQVHAVDWTEIFEKEKTISVIATAHDSELFNNTMYLAQL